jgi:DNA-binding response OmpR family regulator
MGILLFSTLERKDGVLRLEPAERTKASVVYGHPAQGYRFLDLKGTAGLDPGQPYDRSAAGRRHGPFATPTVQCRRRDIPDPRGSFEPVAAPFAKLAAAASTSPEWHVQHCGLGSHPATRTMYVSDDTAFSSHLEILTHGVCKALLFMRVLLVEDEPSAARMLAKGLRDHAHAVDVIRDGQAASEQLARTPYDVVVLDVMLPRKSGLEICRDLRRTGSVVPVLMLTARHSIDDRVAGFESGADDYLVKPFDFRELLARLRALGRRGTLPLLPDRVEAGPITLDTRHRTVCAHGMPIVLTAREYALLEFLCRRRGDVVTRKQIAEHVWDDDYDPLSNVIDVYVQRLRRKLDPPGQPSLIRAWRGTGYQLTAGGAGS